jgi:tetratricopeptide (TPR) repeat protein
MVALPPTSPDNTLNEAIEDHKAGRIEKALKGYRRVLKRNPTHLDALILGGQAAYAAGQSQDALRWLKRASEKHPENPQGSYNLGVLQKSIGNNTKALEAFRLSSQSGPDFAPAHYNVAITLHELGQSDEAIEFFDHTISADQNHAEAFSSKAFVLREQNKIKEAIEVYRNAVRIMPENAKAWVGLGTCLQEDDQLDEAVTAHQTAVSIDLDYPDAVSNLCDAFIQMKRPDEALAACDEFLARHPGDGGVLAAKSIALNEAGNSDEFNVLVDIERFVRPMKLETPSSFPDMDAFNKSLAKHVIRHPTLVTSPSSHTTRLGKQTGTINAGSKGPIAAFENLIAQGITTYMNSVSECVSHPIVAHSPKQYNLSVWGTVLEGEGYQAPHIHPSGWLSGVYYVQVPQVANDGGNDGWIEFGQPGPEYHFSAEPNLQLLKPEPGLMVMFPSYMFHRTIPFESNETRISIAFDVVPA